MRRTKEQSMSTWVDYFVERNPRATFEQAERAWKDSGKLNPLNSTLFRKSHEARFNRAVGATSRPLGSATLDTSNL